MSYRFLDGQVITPQSPPPLSNEERIRWLEARVSDLEAVIIAMAGGGVTRQDIAEMLKGQ